MEHTLNSKGSWRTFTTSDGLAGLQVEHIAEDGEGYLWFATSPNGVSRFDGATFQTFNRENGLCGNQVKAMHLDREDRLWFGTFDGGACWYDGRQFHNFDGDDGVSNGSITFIFEDEQGQMWFAGRNVLGRYDGHRICDMRPELSRDLGNDDIAECWGIAQDEAGNIWFGFDQLLLRYDGLHFCDMSKDEGLKSDNFTVAGDGRDGLWIGGVEGKLWHWDGHTFSETAPPAKPLGRTRKLQCDRQGRTWLSHWYGCLLF